jgi:hypothetical protein
VSSGDWPLGEWIDLGHDHKCRTVTDPSTGQVSALWVSHVCSKHSGEGDASYIPLRGPNPWTLEKLDPITISPSLLRTDCGDHGFIREGKWVPA